ncbi:MAG: fimbrillin family protein, partial [Bacteroidales bacterium]|nr:fimbrillin family protein [Bacteroidales bacterium]
SGVASKAAFNFSPTELSPEWIIDETEEPLDIKETYSDARELSVFSTNIMGTGGNAMLIPQNLENSEAYIAVCVQIKTKDGALVYPRPTTDNLISAEYEWVYVPIDTEWESGYRYVYTLDFTNGAGIDEDGVPVLGGDISFTVEKVKSWNEATSDQSITRLLIGTWELERVEINRTYHSDGRVVQTVLEGDGLDDEYEVMQAFRTLRCYSDSEYYIYPGVENYETKLNYTIENGYFKLFGVVNNDGEPVTDLLIREISKTSLVYTLEYVNDWNVKQYVNYFKRIEDIPILAEKAANDNVE